MGRQVGAAALDNCRYADSCLTAAYAKPKAAWILLQDDCFWVLCRCSRASLPLS